MQLAETAKVSGQALFCTKSPLLMMLLMFSANDPLLVRVIACEVLTVPTNAETEARGR